MIIVKRFLVVFQSHPIPPSDATVVDVYAKNVLLAVRKARKEVPPHHEWCLVSVAPWPKGCANVDEAAERLMAG